MLGQVVARSKSPVRAQLARALWLALLAGLLLLAGVRHDRPDTSARAAVAVADELGAPDLGGSLALARGSSAGSSEPALTRGGDSGPHAVPELEALTAESEDHEATSHPPVGAVLASKVAALRVRASALERSATAARSLWLISTGLSRGPPLG